MFNIQTDEWRSIKDLSTARAYMGIACMGNKIYLVGGMVSSEGSDQYGMGDDEDDFVDVTETRLFFIIILKFILQQKQQNNHVTSHWASWDKYIGTVSKLLLILNQTVRF